MRKMTALILAAALCGPVSASATALDDALRACGPSAASLTDALGRLEGAGWTLVIPQEAFALAQADGDYSFMVNTMFGFTTDPDFDPAAHVGNPVARRLDAQAFAATRIERDLDRRGTDTQRQDYLRAPGDGGFLQISVTRRQETQCLYYAPGSMDLGTVLDALGVARADDPVPDTWVTEFDGVLYDGLDVPVRIRAQVPGAAFLAFAGAPLNLGGAMTIQPARDMTE